MVLYHHGTRVPSADGTVLYIPSDGMQIAYPLGMGAPRSPSGARAHVACACAHAYVRACPAAALAGGPGPIRVGNGRPAGGRAGRPALQHRRGRGAHAPACVRHCAGAPRRRPGRAAMPPKKVSREGTRTASGRGQAGARARPSGEGRAWAGTPVWQRSRCASAFRSGNRRPAARACERQPRRARWEPSAWT